ncbi:hypothetical protein [Thiosocius teredinicola]|uniref:hypothetical protein n=1 Tax=Thiosocius teredinicola TaxID=1973002 RepID=UPI000F776E70
MAWIGVIGRTLWFIVVTVIVGVTLVTSLVLMLNAHKSGEPVPIGGIAILGSLFFLLLAYAGSRRLTEEGQKSAIQLAGGVFIAAGICAFIWVGPRTFGDCEISLVCRVFKPLPPYSFEVVLSVLGLPIAYKGIKNGLSVGRGFRP